MIRHVVMFRFAEGTPADFPAQLTATLRAMVEEIPEVRRYDIGPDAGINQGNHDYVVVADFDDLAGYLAYRDHPDHQRVIREVITPNAGARAAVQYELP